MDKSKTKKPDTGFSSSETRFDEGIMKDMEKTGSNVKGRVDQMKEKASTIVHDLQDEASSRIGQVDDAVSATGRRIEGWAEGIRQNTPDQGVMGAATGRIADTLESGGRYLEEHGLTGMVQDLTDLVRRNPIPALLLGVGVGFVLARATAPRN